MQTGKLDMSFGILRALNYILAHNGIENIGGLLQISRTWSVNRYVST